MLPGLVDTLDGNTETVLGLATITLGMSNNGLVLYSVYVYNHGCMEMKCERECCVGRTTKGEQPEQHTHTHQQQQ